MLPGDHPSGPYVAARLERSNPSRHRRFSGRNEQFLIRDLFDLAPRRDCHVSPSPPTAVRLVSAALVLAFRPAGVTRYAALRSSDFPPPVVNTRSDRPACPPLFNIGFQVRQVYGRVGQPVRVLIQRSVYPLDFHLLKTVYQVYGLVE